MKLKKKKKKRKTLAGAVDKMGKELRSLPILSF
jgi:hypothetical protein